MGQPTFHETTEWLWEAVPAVHREEDELQPVAAINRATNPGFATNAGWVTNDAAKWARTVVTSPVRTASPAAQFTKVPASAASPLCMSAYAVGGTGGRLPATKGTRVRADVWFSPKVAGYQGSVNVSFWNAAGVLISSVVGSPVALTVGLFLNARVDATAPEGTVDYWVGADCSKLVGNAADSDWCVIDDVTITIDDPGSPMKRWISALGDQLGAVNDVIDLVDFEPLDSREDPDQAESALANADLAPAEWLPWIGQIFGVRDNPTLTDVARRMQIKAAVNGFRSGTKSTVAAAAQAFLTGDKQVSVYDHSVTNPHDAPTSEWDVLIITRASETTVSSAALIAGIELAGAKPAGVKLHHRTFTTTWTALLAARPTWADWNGHTWAEIQETGL